MTCSKFVVYQILAVFRNLTKNIIPIYFTKRKYNYPEYDDLAHATIYGGKLVTFLTFDHSTLFSILIRQSVIIDGAVVGND